MRDSTDNLGQVGEDTAALIKAADSDRNARARARREERKQERAASGGSGLQRVVINQPHKVQFNGRSLAITVAPTDGSQQRGGESGSRIEFAVYASASGDVGVTMGNVTGFAGTDVNPWPAEFMSPDYKAEFPPSGSVGVAWLSVTVSHSTGHITGIHVGEAETLPSNTSTTGYLTLGTYATDSGLRILSGGEGNGNQFYYYCAGNHLFGPA